MEHFKTQVLLLHSQQSTLDVLSARLGDRYAVHVATSGSEALTTLGETPIHVIVSAHRLPGMSGLEALREAKKRSPDTIGILLAGDSRDDGLEALVSDQEVFQIVRGAITPESLLQLVDQATKRIRLLALGESANDQAANVDEPAGEHIIMETSENGATIISDGTGRMRALRPHGAQVVAHVGGRDVDVLVLTKDEDFLTTIRESSRGLHNVHHANTMRQAEDLAKHHRIGVLVTDAAMASTGIESLTAQLRASAPRLVGIVAGRRDDGDLLMDLINRGHVYRFLLKPISPGRARLAIEASVKHHLEAPDSAFRRKAGGRQRAPATSASPAPAKPVPAKAAPAKRDETPAAPAARRSPTIDPSPAAKTEPPPTTATPGERLGGPLRKSGRLRRTVRNLVAARGPLPGRKTANLKTGAAPTAKDAPGGGIARLLSPVRLAGAAAALLAVVVVGWWLTASGPESADSGRVAGQPGPADDPASDAMPSIVEVDVPRYEALPEEVRPAVTPAPWQVTLAEARVARDAGEIVAPPGNSAIELYVAARNMAPDNAEILAELDAAINDALTLVEDALLNQRAGDAAAALGMVKLADPEHPRLAFLEAQVAQLELRTRLDQARAAIRQNRFEDAAGALAAARRLTVVDRSEINAVAQELTSARSAQRLDEVLARASQRLAENALTEPANDNARYYYELALSNDAGNVAARQGLVTVASKLVLQARGAIDNGQLDEAERALQAAAELDPASSDLAASMQALENARAARGGTAPARTERVVQGERRGESNQRASTGPAASSGPAAAAERAAGEVGQPGDATSGSQDEASAQYALAAPTGAGQEGSGGTTDARASGSQDFVAISTLERTNYVAPRYPRLAQRRGITGWVDLSFTVLPDGTVADIDIMNSDPGEIFDESAAEAVAEWRFEPPTEDGMPVQKRAAVRLMFSLQ